MVNAGAAKLSRKLNSNALVMHRCGTAQWILQNGTSQAKQQLSGAIDSTEAAMYGERLQYIERAVVVRLVHVALLSSMTRCHDILKPSTTHRTNIRSVSRSRVNSEPLSLEILL